MPNRYYATLTLSEQSYTFNFIGEMYMAALYTPALLDPSVDKTLAPKQILSEFKRVIKERKPTHFEVRSIEPSLFQTKFSYTSPYTYPEASGLFNFHKEDNILTVTSRHLSAEDKELLRKYNIPSSGTICIKAYGNIIENNAHEPANILQQCSTWNMKNLDESVKMIIRFPKSLDVR